MQRVPVAFTPVITRILTEEKTLRQTLLGYDEYTISVRFRLIPAVCKTKWRESWIRQSCPSS